MLKAGDKWHGFGDLAAGFNLLDPIKSTIITPGLDVSGQVRQDRHSGGHRHQVPGRARHRGREDGPVLLLHHVHHRHHQGPLEHAADGAAAVQGRLRQERADVARAARVLRRHPRYERTGLRDLCQNIHDMYAKGDIARLVTEMYLSDLHPAMKPSDAFARIAHRRPNACPSTRSKAASPRAC
jgi:arginine decarboxylase